MPRTQTKPRAGTQKLVALEDLRGFPGNAWKGDVEKIKASLEALGQYRPIVVNVGDGELGQMTILAGNHTWQAHRELAEEEDGKRWRKIRASFVDVDDETARQINIADNRIPQLGGWDEEALAPLLEGISTDGLRALEITGYTETDLGEMLERIATPAGDELEDPPAPAAPKRPTSRRGDLIRMGDHRLLCGDSTDAGDVKKLVGDGGVDLIVTSPPYNVDVEYGDANEGRRPWEEYGDFLRRTLEIWLPHLRPGRAVVWNIGSAPSIYPHRQAALLEDVGLTYVRQLVWRKMGVALPKWHFTQRDPRARRFTPNPTHEVVWVFAKGELEIGDPIGDVDELAQHDVFEIHQSQATQDLPEVPGAGRTGSSQSQQLKTRARKAHPAPFPVRLPAMYVRHLAGPGEVVADPFGGAGTVAIAAEQLSRRSLTMEIEPAYCDVAAKRWQKLTGRRIQRPKRSRRRRS